MKINKRITNTLIIAVLIAALPLAALFDFVWADDGFYVIAVGKRAKRTILVSPQNTQTASGTALLNAVNGITDASAAKPYLVIVEPGIYDIGANSLQMKPYVDIQGSGEKVTRITGSIDSTSAGVLMGATNAELRFITVEHTGGVANARAIVNINSSPMITHVTAIAPGESTAIAVYNETSSPTMTHVTATASGGSTDYRVLNTNSSSPTMTHVIATASGGSLNYGVFNGGSSMARIDHSVISGATNSVNSLDAGSSAYVGNTRLEGGPVLGTAVCAGVYDENYTFYPSACT